MFVLAALAPVALMAVLSFVQVSDVLRQERDRELVRSARSYGTVLSERLQWVESMLIDAGSTPSPLSRLAPPVGNVLTGVALLDRSGRPVTQIGQPLSLAGFDPLSIDPSQQKRRTALLTNNAGNNVAPELVYAVPGSNENGFIAVALAPAFLWGDRAGDPENTGLCVAASSGKQRFCSQPIPEKAWLRLVVETPHGERMTRLEG